MLKTLRVTSFVIVILAAMGVIAIIGLGLKGNPEVKAYLEKPGIVDTIRGQSAPGAIKEEQSSPLVALAQKIALRFDPPAPPKPVVEKTPQVPTRVQPVRSAVPPTPKVQTSAKFDLLATVVYKTAPEKSLALLKTGLNKQEWFRQGETAGHLEVQEIRDGSVLFTQGGGRPQELFVPVKPQTQPLLKGEAPVSGTGPGSITSMLAAPEQTQTNEMSGRATSNTRVPRTTDSGKVQMVRPRTDISERIQRVRSVPPTPPQKEEKKDINEMIQGISDLMSREDDSASEDARNEENQMWLEMLKKLNAEKKELDTAKESKDSAEKDKR